MFNHHWFFVAAFIVCVLNTGQQVLAHSGGHGNSTGGEGGSASSYERVAYCDNYQSLAEGYEAEGRVLVEHGSDGTTRTTLEATIVLDGEEFLMNGTYMSHLHEASCEEAGGAHWKKDPDLDDESTSNEVHVMLGSNMTMSVAHNDFLVDDRIRSIVVHLPDSSKVACCDFELEGALAPASSSEGNDGGEGSAPSYEQVAQCNNYQSLAKGYEAEGRVLVEHGSDGTTRTTLEATILLDGEEVTMLEPCMSHLHEASCEEEGGAHWKNDPNLDDASTANEVHVMLGSNMTMSVAHNEFLVDDRIRSIVVHLPDSSKIICCDFELEGVLADASMVDASLASFAFVHPTISIFSVMSVFILFSLQ